jgi:hypothetical protein
VNAKVLFVRQLMTQSGSRMSLGVRTSQRLQLILCNARTNVLLLRPILNFLHRIRRHLHAGVLCEDHATRPMSKRSRARARSSHRANGHSLSRHRFAWCPFQRRQLQDGGVLTRAQLRDQDNFPIGKLKRVVMHGWLV